MSNGRQYHVVNLHYFNRKLIEDNISTLFDECCFMYCYDGISVYLKSHSKFGWMRFRFDIRTLEIDPIWFGMTLHCILNWKLEISQMCPRYVPDMSMRKICGQNPGTRSQRMDFFIYWSVMFHHYFLSVGHIFFFLPSTSKRDYKSSRTCQLIFQD